MSRDDFDVEQNEHDQCWYALFGGHSLADVPRWVHDGSHDRNSVVPDPALDWVYGPYQSEAEARGHAEGVREEAE